MSLEIELKNLENSIRDAIVGGEEFEYHKLLRAKTETESRIFFQKTAQLKSEIENLQSERSFGLSVRDDLTDELKQASDIVLQARSRLFDAEQAYQAIQAKQFYLDTKLEQERKDIKALQQKLDAHVASKLNSGDSPTNEVFTNEDTH